MSKENNGLYEFADFTLNPQERLLLRAGKAVPLTPKAFETLVVLVERAGSVVAKEELLEKVWQDTFVEESSLTRNISVLRKALAQSQFEQPFIETVSKKGYRFLPAVKKRQIESPLTTGHHTPPATNDFQIKTPDAESQNSASFDEPVALPAPAETALANRKSKIQNPKSVWLNPLSAIAAALILIFAVLAWRGGQRTDGQREQEVAVTTNSKSSATQMPDSGGVVNLTANAANDSGAAVSPDGKRIAFVSNRDGGANEIYVMDVDGSNLRRVTDNRTEESRPAWSPDNKQIVFVSVRGNRRNIFVMNADGTNERQLTENASDDMPQFSPDGAHIAFHSANRDGGGVGVFVMNADGSRPKRLSSANSKDYSPRWSPDGTQIVFATHRDARHPDDADVYRMKSDGTEPVRLTNQSGTYNISPTFSPDGTRIYFVRTTRGSRSPPSLHWMRIDGSHVERLSDDRMGITEVVVAPDNSQVILSGNRGSHLDVYSMPVPANAPRLVRLTDNAARDSLPTFSPDGARIAFASNRDGDSEIYTMNLDGTDLRQITNNDYEDLCPAYSPDGKRIAFENNSEKKNGIGTLQIYVMNAEDGSDTRQITSEPRGCGRAAFAPDGARLAFQCAAENKFYLFTARADGSDGLRVTAYDVHRTGADPTFSPDGRHIAFSSDRETGGVWTAQIFVGNTNATNIVRRTNFQTTAHHTLDVVPTWSPDGGRIAFMSNRDGNFELYVMNADGSQQERLTNHVEFDSEPAWSPDGKSLVFNSRRDGNQEIYLLSVPPQGR